ncbi:MAG TPA: winged helix-turn-helix domain-containing protein [Bryobacteraceae bacterium]|nr:winged helix-turn-helix domain-containing protein [Bryobacteraceae bacterium]
MDLKERELRKFGLRIRLQQKPFRVLERLLQTPGEFVPREELARLLWPNLHVLFDRSLNTAVNALRRALGDDGRNPRFIETRLGLGYVFIAAVETLAEPAPTPRLPAERASPHSPEAYQEYLKGRYFANKLTEPEIRKSVAYFESAIGRDPDFALAHAGLADTWMLFAMYGLLPPADCLARAGTSAETALRLDSTLAESHTSIARVQQLRDLDWKRAESSHRRALALNPNDAAAHRQFALYRSALRRFEEARREIGIAIDLDPLSLVVNMHFAWILWLARDFSAAAEQSWKTLAMEPRFAPAQNTLGLAYEQMGMLEEAMVEFENARVCSENHPAALAALAHVLASAGKPAEAGESLAELKRTSETRYVSPYWFAVAHAGLGEDEIALASLERGFAERDVWMTWIATEPRFDGLRHHPRFEKLAGGMGFAQTIAAGHC